MQGCLPSSGERPHSLTGAPPHVTLAGKKNGRRVAIAAGSKPTTTAATITRAEHGGMKVSARRM